MGIPILDGRGRGFSASVSESNRLNVSAKTADRPFYISRDKGRAFVAVSVDASADAGDFIFYIKNTSQTKNLYVGEIHFSAANAALWKLWQVTGTASGTAITPTNLNLSSGITSETTVLGNGAVTGLTGSMLLHSGRHGASGEEEFEFFGALLLGPNDALGVEYDTGTTGTAEVTTEFWFEDIERKN